MFDPDSLERRLDRLSNTNYPRSVIDEMLLARIPIHFGGMSDPFPDIEKRFGVSLRLLKVLARHQYPTIISTKGTLLGIDQYLSALQAGRFIVQVSINSMDDDLLAKTDVGTPGPTASIGVLRKLSEAGIPTTCRIQPLLPGFEVAAAEVISACAEARVRHVAVEHLKLPIEITWKGTARLSEALGFDLPEYFRKRSAKVVGREWVLPTEERIERICNLRSTATRLGITFGAADNDLLYLSDGKCCCSGIDNIDTSMKFFEFNYTEAVRRADDQGNIFLDSLDSIWRPVGSIGQYINSNSRIPSSFGNGKGVSEYIRKNWNSTSANSPSMFYGVEESGRTDKNGFKVYTLASTARKLISNRLSHGNSL